MNDDLWMLGTSRSLAAGFSKSLAASSPGAETGMLVEVEFAPIRTWLADIYRRNEIEAKELAGSTPDEMKGITAQADLDRIAEATKQLQSLRYRKWLADGKPRTSLHIRLSLVE